MEETLKHHQIMCNQNPSTDNINRLEILKTEYDLRYEYITKGEIIRSRARWYEEGEKSNKYLLNLESSRGNKRSIRKIYTRDQSLTTSPKVIMEELSNLYSDLYHEKPSNEILMASFLEKVSIPKLTEAQKEKCGEKLTVNEC